MISNYFKIALRTLLRQKTYSFINISGLVIGVAASLLILLYVADELSYDRFHSDAKNIYRVNFHAKLQGQDILSAQTGMPMAEALQREGTGVEAVVRVEKWMTCPVRYEEKAFTEMNFLLADSNFFSFFDFPLIAGNAKDALLGPNKIVISETAAKRYFNYQGPGDRSPLGKILVIGSEGAITAEVTGIARNVPENSHLRFDFMMSLETSGYPEEGWLNSEVHTYFKTVPGTDIAGINQTLDRFIKKYCEREIQQGLNQSLEEFLKQGGNVGFTAHPMVDIHLKSAFPDELEPNSSIEYVYLFSGISGFILLLACINFMNLSTARSANRAKEIGVRKAIGAMRQKLIRQFLTESFLYTIIAFGLALCAVHVLIGPFNSLTGKAIESGMLYHPVFISGFVLLMLIVGFLAGTYPAFYLTSFNAVDVLKGKLRSGAKNSGLRNSLVVFQFVISIALIIASVMVYQQLSFLQNREVGFQKDNVIGLMHTMNLGSNSHAFKEELLRYPDFVAASYSSRLPPNVDWGSTFQTNTGNESYAMAVYGMDYDHLKTLGLTMAKGRFFSRDFISDSSAMIINETAARMMGIENLDEKKVRFGGAPPEMGRNVIGIIKDFNFETLKTSIRPLVIFLQDGPNWDIAVRLSAGNTAAKVKRLEEIWKKFAPNTPFEYSFIDENFNAKFKAEQRLSQVILVFTGLAILIACLGLFGLSTFIAEQRSKEVSIRKVMGATVPEVIVLLSSSFFKLVVISFLIAVPITWYAMNQWLEGFAYRIDFSLIVAFLAGITALVIALFTVSFQAIKVAIGNPVNWLRSE
jgi:putative ABC transport system permease protein